MPQLPRHGVSWASPAFAGGFTTDADPSSFIHKFIGYLIGPLRENHGPFSTLQDALSFPESQLSSGHSNSCLCVPVSANTCPLPPVHVSFLSGASEASYLAAAKPLLDSPFLCGCWPAGQHYFPECPHCMTCGTSPQFCFLSEILRHRRVKGVGGTSEKILDAIVHRAPFL